VIAECNKLVEQTIEAFGGLDIIIGNAVSVSYGFFSAYHSGATTFLF